MTEEQIALAKRAVACKGWRWMSGMLRGDGFRCTWVDEDERELAAPTWCANGIEWMNSRTGSKDLPDLTDPATLGCLLALVRDAYGDSALYVRLSDTTRQSDGVRAWEVLGWISAERSRDGRGGSWRGWGYVSEAEALVAALEAAP
jgi:hypothetical protein